MKIDISKLNIVKVTRKNAIAYCPIHKDSNRPNFHISIVAKYYGYYRCFSCGASGWFTEKEMEKLDLKKKTFTKTKKIDWVNVHLNYRGQYVLPYGKTMPIDSLQHILNLREIFYDVGWDSKTNSYTFPMYNAKEEIIGIQRRFSDGNKCCVGGSQLGIFIPSFLEIKEPVFICEGCSDMLAVCDLGFYAIGRPSASCGDNIIIEWFKRNKIKQCIIIPDNDEIGKQSSYDLAVNIGLNSKCIVRIEPILYTKDIRSYIALVGKDCAQYELEEFIKSIQ